MPLLRRLKTWILPLALSLMVAAPAHANSSTQPPLLMCPAGQNSSTWTDCRGVVELGGGEVYVGGMRQGRFHGDGAYTWGNGSTYVGQWQNGGRHGQGVQTARSGDRFDPSARHDIPWSRNTPYSMLVNQAEGSRYEGQWAFNRKHGQGTMTLPNGDVYMGEFRNDAFEGTGTLTHADGKPAIRGLWSANRFVRELPAQTYAVNPQKKALVIGNDRYTRVSSLQNAVSDSRAIAAALTTLGYQVTLRHDLDDRSMKAALRQFKTEVEGGDEVVFFFAGHGVQIGAANYLLPTDIRGDSEDQVKDESLQLQRVLDDMDDKRVRLTLAIIDACRDNPFPKSGRAIGGRGLAPTTAATGQMVIFSAGAGQQALDKLGPEDRDPNGLFTRALLQEMRVPGVRVDNVIREVRKKVVEAARRIGHEQVPAIYDQVVGDFYFTR